MSTAAQPPATLSVQAVFHGLDERRAQAIAADLIDRAHELANEPAGGCDVDVSVELAAGSPATSGKAGPDEGARRGEAKLGA